MFYYSISLRYLTRCGVRVDALIAFPRFVLRVGTLVEYDLGIALERKDMRSHTVEEPAVVRNYHRTSRKVFETLFERTQRIHVDVVGRLVEQNHVALLFECHCEVQAVALAAR